jgi:hypothetical protein
MLSGEDHDLPLKTRTVPFESTAAQKLGVGQETAAGAPVRGSTDPPKDQAAALRTEAAATTDLAPTTAGHAIAATAVIPRRK